MKKSLWIGIGAVVVAVAWYAFRPELLFINQSVSESFPASSVAANSASAVISPRQLSEGQFKGYAHETMGNAGIYEVNGKRVLRLTDFKTSNGPDVHVYLVAAPDAMDDATVKKAGFLDLGSMKGNMGDQNYDVPDNADLAKYQAVTIWCARFNVNFGTAPLKDKMPAGPRQLAGGKFKGYAHETEGMAGIFDVNGKRVLRLTDFKTSNGPDVHVYLVAAPNAMDDATVKKAGFIDLGSMKGNVGDQNYDVPANTDLAKYQAVTIWCARFNVNFGTAPLAASF
jgi:outer membrane protease